MASSSLLLSMALLTATAAAQTTTVTLPFLGWDQMDISASIVSANPTATTYLLVCGPPPTSTGVDSDYDGCGLFPTQRLIHGPSTYMMDMGVPDGAAAFTGTIDCGDIAKPTVTCKESFAGSEANDPGTSSTEYPGSEVASLKVVVTGGVEKLKAASATSTPASASASPTGSAAAAGSPSQSPAPAASKAAADSNSAVLGGGFSAAVVAALGGMFL